MYRQLLPMLTMFNTRRKSCRARWGEKATSRFKWRIGNVDDLIVGRANIIHERDEHRFGVKEEAL